MLLPRALESRYTWVVMAPPDSYRDETCAAQNRIAMLEEKLEGRGPRDEEEPEIARMLAAKRTSKISANPAVAAGRALTFPLGMLLTLTLTHAGGLRLVQPRAVRRDSEPFEVLRVPR